MLEDVQTNEMSSLESSEEENSTTIEVEEETKVSLRDKMSRKAARLYDESEYSEEEFTSMLQAYDETMKSIEMGNIVQGKVVMITDNSVIVDIGFKSEGSISFQEFGDNSEITVGDMIEVF